MSLIEVDHNRLLALMEAARNVMRWIPTGNAELQRDADSLRYALAHFDVNDLVDKKPRRSRIVVEYMQDDDGPMVPQRLLIDGVPTRWLFDETTSLDFLKGSAFRFSVSLLPSSVEFVKVEREG